MKDSLSHHNRHSSYREKLIEHLFIGELIKISWLSGRYDLEVAKPEVDNAGYDLIIEAAGVLRHVQLKSSYLDSKTATQKIQIGLSEKPSGCVVWIYFDERTLSLGPYRVFGEEAGVPMTNIREFPIAKHSKANSHGVKLERPNIRIVNKGDFLFFENIEDVYDYLFFKSAIPGATHRISNHHQKEGGDSKLRRIELWAKRPHQINHKIIRGFLELYRISPKVEKETLRSLCEEKYQIKTFDNNFVQLQTDRGNSHAKVFIDKEGIIGVYDDAMEEIQKYFIN